MTVRNQYAPRTIQDIAIGNEDSRNTIAALVRGQHPLPADRALSILLYGGYGTGKTTLAKMLPDAIEYGLTGEPLGMEADLFECQSGTTGSQIASAIRKRLDMHVGAFNKSERWYFIIDEIDQLTPKCQRDLKTMMNSRFAVFILTSNHVANMDKGLLSRCIPVEMNAANINQVIDSAHRIITHEGILLSATQIGQATVQCQGDFRRLGEIIRLLARRKLPQFSVIK